MALKTMLTKLKQANAKIGFANMVAIANEAAIVRDFILEEMGEVPLEVDITDPDAEEQIKDDAIEDAELAEFIESIPETEIDDAALAAGKIDEYMNPTSESLQDIDFNIPDTEIV